MYLRNNTLVGTFFNKIKIYTNELLRSNGIREVPSPHWACVEITDQDIFFSVSSSGTFKDRDDELF